MKTNTFLKIAVLILFLINLILIGLMVVGRQKKPLRGNQNDLKEIIAEKLDLDERQRNTYFELAQTHNKAMSEINRKTKPLIRDYFNSLKMEEPNRAIEDSLLTVLDQLNRDKLTLTYSHFGDLKKICNPEQVLVFEGIMDEIIQVLLGNQKKSPPPPRD